MLNRLRAYNLIFLSRFASLPTDDTQSGQIFQSKKCPQRKLSWIRSSHLTKLNLLESFPGYKFLFYNLKITNEGFYRVNQNHSHFPLNLWKGLSTSVFVKVQFVFLQSNLLLRLTFSLKIWIWLQIFQLNKTCEKLNWMLQSSTVKVMKDHNLAEITLKEGFFWKVKLIGENEEPLWQNVREIFCFSLLVRFIHGLKFVFNFVNLFF